jgi:lipopolysaccharide biosynthesis glycosyltransferase
MTNNSESIAIGCGADDQYAAPLAVTLYSTLVNLNSGWSVRLRILDGGFAPESKHRLERVVANTEVPVDLRWCSVNTGALEDLPTDRWINTSSYLRLYLPSVFSDESDKAIYLDSDLLVQESISELWNHDLGDRALAAVRDYKIPYVSSPLGIDHYDELGYSPDTPYFNSGVLLINPRRWRKESVSNRVFEYLREFRRDTHMHDQEGLNAVLAEEWKPLDLGWNVASHILAFDNWPESSFKERVRSKRDQLTSEPFIFHFTGGSKPWHVGCRHPAQLDWIEYLWKSGWFSQSERVRRLGLWFTRHLWWRVKNQLGII